MSKKIYYGWINLAILFLTYALIICPVIYGYGVMVSSMAAGLGMSMTVAALAYTLYAGVNILLQPIAAKFITEKGVKKSILFGVTMGMIGSAIMAFLTKSVILYFVVYDVFLATTNAFATVTPHQTGISKWFFKHRGLAMTLMLSAASFGGYVFPKLIARIVKTTGVWQNGWIVQLISFGIAFLLILLFYREEPKTVGQSMEDFGEAGAAVNAKKSFNAGKLATFKQTNDWEAKRAIRTKAFICIVLMNLVCRFVSTSIQTFGASTFVSKGMDLTMAASIISTYSLVSLVGRLAAAFLFDSIDTRFIARIGFLGCIVGMAFMVFGAGTYQVGMIFAIVFGTCYGASYVTNATMIADYFGKKDYAKICAYQTMPCAIGSMLAPTVCGLAYDLTNSFTGAWIVSFAMLVVALISAIVVKPPKAPQIATAEE